MIPPFSRIQTERVEVLLGLRGDPLDKAVTLRELGGSTDVTKRIGKISTAAGGTAGANAAATVVADVNDRLVNAEAAANSASTSANNALNSANTVAGRVDQVVALNGAGFPGTKFESFIDQLAITAGGTSGTVTAQGSAIASLNGTVDALYKIEVKSGSGGALLQLIAPGGGASVAQLEADYIYLKGKVAADSLLVGLGGNLLQNTDFRQDLRGWGKVGGGGMNGGTPIFAIRPAGTGYAGVTYPTLQLIQRGTTATDGFLDIRAYKTEPDGTTSALCVPVSGDAYYEVSAALSTLRGECATLANWYDAAGVYLSTSSVAHGPRVGSSTNPEKWVRQFGLFQAPTNAAYMWPAWRLNNTDGTSNDKYLFLHKPMVLETHQFATKATPYRGGITTLIDQNGIYTESIVARHLTVGMIQAGAGVIGDLAVDTAQIANLSVDTLKVKDNAITLPVFSQNTATDLRVSDNTVYNTIHTLVVSRSKASFGQVTAFAVMVQEQIDGVPLSDKTAFYDVILTAQLAGGSEFTRIGYQNMRITGFNTMSVVLPAMQYSPESVDITYRLKVRKTGGTAERLKILLPSISCVELFK